MSKKCYLRRPCRNHWAKRSKVADRLMLLSICRSTSQPPTNLIKTYANEKKNKDGSPSDFTPTNTLAQVTAIAAFVQSKATATTTSDNAIAAFVQRNAIANATANITANVTANATANATRSRNEIVYALASLPVTDAAMRKAKAEKFITMNNQAKFYEDRRTNAAPKVDPKTVLNQTADEEISK